MIVAGPGSGKTTVLVLRALRLVFVEAMMPEQVVITTFTRKAADEIRSRLIEWGLALREHLRANPVAPTPLGFETWLDSIDINRFLTGTLDSLCEDTLTSFRAPGDPPPVLVEGFVGNALLGREGMFRSGAWNNPALSAYLTQFTFDGEPPQNFGETVSICRTIVDRIIQDLVNVVAFNTAAPHTPGRQCLVSSLQSYQTYMTQTNRMDFAGLEQVFLERLVNQRLQRFTSNIRALLIDEYQDTNPLQESIYFELIRQTNPSVAVVGDDDQSLYRFRGATVELFNHFAQRLAAAVPQLPPAGTEQLIDNYRSTPEIVTFFNNFADYDPAFATARVQPPKPRIIPSISSNGVPVLGLFRPDVQTLASHVAAFIANVFRGGGHNINVNGHQIPIVRNSQGGDAGDAVLLAHTVDEFGARFQNNPPRARLPLLLRQALASSGIGVFNPRGQALRDIPEVQTLLGLVLECIDPPTTTNPEGTQQAAAHLRRDPRHYLPLWRHVARNFIATNPAPNAQGTLAGFVTGWQNRTNQTATADRWPDEWPILELFYKLVTWLPFFQHDPEGQVYLEAVARCIAQAGTFSTYRSTIIHYRDPSRATHNDRSVLRAIMDIMVPLCEDSVEIDEEIMPHVPRNRLPIMTIHQAKGLEFPLVIVDVASDYARNHPTQRFRRFPEHPSSTQVLEDDLASHCTIGPLRTARPALNRTFDDLIRLYYVAYSRPQSVLMLVGVDPCLRYNTSIQHLATGWRFDGTWVWRNPVSGRPPALVNNHPLELI
jgi:DNA helicase-2/ATP-dependent DNA helicase PcrA